MPISSNVAVVGGGPAGLMAAEVLSATGVRVDVFDAMPSVGRKFLLAGRGGLNLTHAEGFAAFVSRFGERRSQFEALLGRWGPEQLRAWAEGLGVETFVGTSGRVFPRDMKAAPLLRAWLHRLRDSGVNFHMRHRWTGGLAQMEKRWSLSFDSPPGQQQVAADAVVLALGGASWPRLGSDGAWVPWLQALSVPVTQLRPANCGFNRPWSAHFAGRHAGQPFKSVAIRCTGLRGEVFARKGEFVATSTGIEGSLVYAASALLRDTIAAHGKATLWLDLLPGRESAQVLAALQRPRGGRSLSKHLQATLGLAGIKAAVLYELLPRETMQDASALAGAIKALPLDVFAPRPIAEAISSAGGVPFEGVDANGGAQAALPGVFCAGEMLDWEAPTGGYLLTASMATGRAAAQGALNWLGSLPPVGLRRPP